MQNRLPESANITTSGMMCYFLYWFIQVRTLPSHLSSSPLTISSLQPKQFPFLLISPQRIRWLFLVKALIVPAAWLAMLIWAAVKVPTSQGLFSEHSQLSGSAMSWSWLSALNSALGIYATLSVNIPDFTVSRTNQLRV